MEKLNVTELYAGYLKEISDDHGACDMIEELAGNYSSGTYICDAISQTADSAVDIYNSDLKNWLCENVDEYEQAIDELGMPTDSKGRFDFYASIRQAQYITYQRVIYDNIDAAMRLYCYNYIMDKNTEITEEQDEAIIAKCQDVDNNDCFYVYEDFCDKLMEANGDDE